MTSGRQFSESMPHFRLLECWRRSSLSPWERTVLRTVRCGLIQARNEKRADAPTEAIAPAMVEKHQRMTAEAARKGVKFHSFREKFYGPHFCGEEEICLTPQLFVASDNRSAIMAALFVTSVGAHGVTNGSL
jgi:hypothetical protein